SVRLLSRQGEIDLAQRMERGKMRMCKALSRSPLVWQSVLTMYEDALQAKVGLEDFIELGADNREDRQLELTRRLAQFARLHSDLAKLERKVAATPKRHLHVRAKLIGKVRRLQVKCSQQIRSIPFHLAQWKQIRAV